MLKSALLLMLALLATAEQSTPGALAQPPPTHFLHLSDIHFSTNVRKYWDLFGDREGDITLFATQLVPRLRPAAAVVTGDITDSKTARGEGLQQESEWLSYARLLSNLSAAGVPVERVYDVPGNHDTFNMPVRGGPNDYFAKHAAEGQRRASVQQRVYVHPLQAAPAAGAQEAAEAGCPAAWLLGVDPTPNPGLRSPTNFAGLAGPELMAEARAALLSIQEQQQPGCGPPLILAYCHYPLSTIDSTAAGALPGPPGILLHAAHSALAMQGLTQLLAEHNVSAVLSGHLHSSFGQRLHRLHATPGGGYMAELETAAWKDDRRFRLVGVDGGTVSFADLMFHTRNSPRMLRRSDAASMQDPAWQEAYEQRGWAVTALDPSAAVLDHIVLITSPADARYSPLGLPAAQQPRGQDNDGEPAAALGGAGAVHALVFALGGEQDGAGGAAAEAAAGGTPGLEVTLSGFLPSGVKLFSRAMQLQQGSSGSGGGGSGSGAPAAGPLLYEAQGEATVSCVGASGDPAAHCHAPAQHVLIQVTVQAASGRVSRSPRQPAALHCAPLTSSDQRCWVASVLSSGQPLPLRASFLEWLGLAFNWPVLVHRLFLCAWILQVGALLLAPRLLRSRVLPLIAASPLLQCAPAGPQPASTPRDAATGGVVAQAARSAVAFLVWPLAALFVCAGVTEVWAALLAYSGYLLVGPWLAYNALSGYPPALMFHFGVLGRLAAPAAGGAGAPPGWLFVGTPDTMFVSLVHTVLCLLPATLWVACVVARRVQLQHQGPAAVSRCSSSSDSSGSGEGKRRMEAGGGSASSSASLLSPRGGSLRTPRGSLNASGATGGCCGRWSFSGCQLAALAALAALNGAGVYHKACILMGSTALLLSPGLFWTLPLAVLLVTLWDGPKRPNGPAAKGE